MTPHGEANPTRDPWDGRNPEDDAAFQSKLPQRVNPWSQPDVDRAFSALVADLVGPREADAVLSPLVTSRGERIDLSVLDKPLHLDLRLGLTNCELIALCQLCVTGMSVARRRRVCQSCLRVDRKLATALGGVRFLPTTRKPCDPDRCVTIARAVASTPQHQRFGRARGYEQHLWQQMDETFQSNLRLLTDLGGFDARTPLPYEDWAGRWRPGQARSLDAYLSYAQLHLPWAVPTIHRLIEELEVGAA